MVGREFWDSQWKRGEARPCADPVSEIEGDHINAQLARCLLDALATAPAGAAVLEVGCANSQWLPFLAQKGIRVAGLDYSEVGCERTRRILQKSGVSADVICQDVLFPNAELENRYGAVLSFGVAEHFADTAACITALARFAVPGGLIFTLIPNMTAFLGFAQRCADQTIYNHHVPLTVEQLARAHEAAGLRVELAEPLLFLNAGVLNVERFRGSVLRLALVAAFVGLNRAVEFWERTISRLPANRWTSPYYVCVARKPIA